MALLKENPSGSEIGPDRLELLMTAINPRASLSLPDCWDTEGCQIEVPHPDVLADAPEVETLDDEDIPQEDVSTDSLPKPDDRVENEEEKVKEDETENEVNIVGVVKVAESTNTNGVGVNSGISKTSKKSKGSKTNRRDSEGRKLNSAAVPRIYKRGAIPRRISHKVTPDLIPEGVLSQFSDQFSRHTLNIQRELLCISAAMRHKSDPRTYPRIRLVPTDFYDSPFKDLETRGLFLASLRSEDVRRYYFPEEPTEKKSCNSYDPTQDHHREARPLFNGRDICPPHLAQDYYPHDHFGSNPSYYGFNKQRLSPTRRDLSITSLSKMTICP